MTVALFPRFTTRDVDAAIAVFDLNGPDECMPCEDAGQILASEVVELRRDVARLTLNAAETDRALASWMKQCIAAQDDLSRLQALPRYGAAAVDKAVAYYYADTNVCADIPVELMDDVVQSRTPKLT